jgi:hypothetical protein
MVGPAEWGSIVAYVEEYRIWIICSICCCKHMQGCAVVYDNHDNLENVD